MLEPQSFRASAKDDCCCDKSNPHTPQSAASLNLLDSRALGRASCFAQRFMRPGTYAYNVVAGRGGVLNSSYPFAILVEDGPKGEMAQHNVVVGHGDKGLTVDESKLRIKTGDLVLWSGNGLAVPFAVVGERDFFSSERMVNECGYSHAFGTEGEYRWRDAHGSGIGGVIRVSNPKASDAKALSKWREALAEGSIVMIQDGKIDKPELEIMTGQTVFFAIITSPGISVTDERLLDWQADGKKAA
jgi:plastocyanin